MLTKRLLPLAPLAILLAACAGSGAAPSNHGGSTAPDAPAAGPTAQDVIARHIHATGARKLVESSTSSHVLGSIELAAMGLKGDLEIRAAKPNRFWMSTSLGPAGTTVVAYDGQVGWMSSPMMGGTSLLDGVELFAMQMQADYEAALMKPESYDEMVLEGREEYEGRDCWKVKLVYKAPADPELAKQTLKTRTTTNWFDVETGRQVAQSGTQSSPQGELPVTTTFDEYAERAGILMPVQMTQKVMGMEVVTRIDDFELNTVDAAAFARPAEVQTLLEDK